MKTTSFVKLLRKVIREEVRSAVKEILAEQKVSHNSVIDHGMNLHELASNPNPYEVNAKKPKKKKFVKDSVLNDILNETAVSGDFASMAQGIEPPTLGNKTWDTSMAETYGMKSTPQTLATTDTNGKPVDMNNEAVATTVNAFTKDYSQLMKAIDKKKGIK